MTDNIDRLKLKSTLRDPAFWLAVLPLLASVHPDARDFLAERWELVAVVIGYLAHNGYLRGKVVQGAAMTMAYSAPQIEVLDSIEDVFPEVDEEEIERG